ncbi:MAG: hypothetical protein JW801_11355 [Bacteroidales bacterium]|nr:hypothetical protein [Bacteroidales bacterium]
MSKRIFQTLILFFLISPAVYSQWASGSGYTTTDDWVGIGPSSTAYSNYYLTITSTTGTSDIRRNLHSVNTVNTGQMTGTSTVRIGDSYDWDWGGNMQGVISLLSGVDEIRLTNSTKTANVLGGHFGITIDDPFKTPTVGRYRVAGLRTYLDGNITTYPSNGVVSAFYSQDLINDTSTWAGYFEGKTYFNDKVGIGTQSPDEMLTVAGIIKAEGINVMDIAMTGTLNAGSIQLTANVPQSDFVFENDYELMSLEELNSYISEKKHLPGVPSAEEFRTEGYNVGQMDDILLRKIEELTLYTVEQQSLIEEQNEMIQLLIEELAELKQTL